MTEVKKKKLADRRTLLSNRLIESLKPKNVRYSIGDSEVIGLRIFVFEGGQKTFYYSYTTKDKKKGLEKLGLFGSVNVKEARNTAKKIATEVMNGRSPIEIKISKSGELTVAELVKAFLDRALKAPRYKPSTQKKWRTNVASWIYQESNDPILRAMYAKTKLKIANKKLSECTKDFMKEWHAWIGTKTESQANALVEMLSVIFNWGIEQKFQKHNPAQFKKDELYDKKEDNRILTKVQKTAVLNHVLKYDERKEARLNMDYYTNNKLSVVSCCLIAYSLLTGRRYRSEGGSVDLHRAVTAGFKQESALDTILEWIKTRCVVWKNGEKTRQVRLDNGERPRAYMLPPMYDAEAADPESAKNYWINNLREKTDTELGVIYNSKGTIKPFF